MLTAKEFRLKVTIVLATAIILVLSLIRPLYPREQLLQHAPTILALLLLAVEARKKLLSTTAFVCVVVFVWLHIVGARYIYSYVPYDDWAASICGTSISDYLGWQRNHYDRLVHFFFGTLLMVPMYDVATIYGRMRSRWVLMFSLFAVMTLSALYEVFEWLLTVVVSPTQAGAYNGQQGDVWDAQKDMALAFAGSLLTIPFLAIRNRCRGNGCLRGEGTTDIYS